MDRRGFIKTAFFSPLFIPYLHASQSFKKESVLYLIADAPQMFLSAIIQELKKYGYIHGHRFTHLNFYPEEKDIKEALTQEGWRYVSEVNQADFSLSFTHLRQKASPSFTLIEGSRVRDIRSSRLSNLWKEMNKHHPSSSLVTVASFKGKHSDLYPGNSASIYIEGHMVKRLSLKKNYSNSFRTKKGNITITVEGGKAWASDSSCRHKICQLSPPIALSGDRIICAPNHFLLEINCSPSVDTVIG